MNDGSPETTTLREGNQIRAGFPKMTIGREFGSREFNNFDLKDVGFGINETEPARATETTRAGRKQYPHVKNPVSYRTAHCRRRARAWNPARSA